MRNAVTDLRRLLGVDLPIIQAPMAGVQDSELTLSVSRAGALGSLPCAALSLQKLEAELALLQTECKQPYNVNFFSHVSPTPEPQREAQWRQLLNPYYAAENIEIENVPASAGRMPFSAEILPLLSRYRPPIVSFHFGLPSPALVQSVKALGIKILSSASTVAEARWLAQHGVDAVIAQGLEAGGHRAMFLTQDVTTQMGTFALLPQVVQAVTVPVIAAGGNADAQGVAAAMHLGAAGVQVGSAYLLSTQARTSRIHRAAIQSDAAVHTALTNLFTGRLARGIVNRVMRELGAIHPAAPAFPLATAAMAPLRECAEAQGRADFSPLWCGQNVSRAQTVCAAVVTHALAQGLPSL
jgi:nitronate monooxygenase